MAHLGYLQLTRQCMQSCIYCSNPPTGVELDIVGLRETLDRFAAMECAGVILTGGEPTLSPLLLPALEEAAARRLAVRVITNGQLFAERSFLVSCVERGLGHIHLSLYSHRPEVHDGITGVSGSWARAVRCLENACALGLNCDINTVISTRNAGHLHEAAAWLCGRFPLLRHFVWNNLDPSGDRARSHPEVVARLADFEVGLEMAMEFLERSGRSFRAERVPLCAMRRFPWASTETRKIVKGEARSVRFLDVRGLWHQDCFRYSKGAACGPCRFGPICAGLFLGGEFLSEGELSPVFEDPVPVVERVLGRRPGEQDLRRLGLPVPGF